MRFEMLNLNSDQILDKFVSNFSTKTVHISHENRY
jgi:hypothetical protein